MNLEFFVFVLLFIYGLKRNSSFHFLLYLRIYLWFVLSPFFIKIVRIFHLKSRCAERVGGLSLVAHNSYKLQPATPPNHLLAAR